MIMHVIALYPGLLCETEVLGTRLYSMITVLFFASPSWHLEYEIVRGITSPF